MAENFGAKFSIDITNLKKGLATANKLIKENVKNNTMIEQDF